MSPSTTAPTSVPAPITSPSDFTPSAPTASAAGEGRRSESAPATAAVKDGGKKSESSVDLKGFVAGTASGVTKLVVGHPFDMIKVRLQCSPVGTYAGPLDALKKTVGAEGLRALYKGATPPLIGWTLSDSMLMGVLHSSRVAIAKYESRSRSGWRDDGGGASKEGGGKEEPLALSLKGHWLAGLIAGQAVCFVAAPTEHLKARLQMQSVGPKLYSGPIDCAKKIYALKGIPGLWHGLGATLIFRSWMGVMFLTYEINMRILKKYQPDMSPGTRNFWAGGMASNWFWTAAFPFDAIKNRLMTDSLTNPKYPSYMAAARGIWLEGGVKAFYRGFVPSILRAFPTNASAALVWTEAMRMMGTAPLEARG